MMKSLMKESLPDTSSGLLDAQLSFEKEASRTDPGLRCSRSCKNPTNFLVDFELT